MDIFEYPITCVVHSVCIRIQVSRNGSAEAFTVEVRFTMLKVLRH